MIYIQISFTLYIIFILFNIYILLTHRHSFNYLYGLYFLTENYVAHVLFLLTPFRFAPTLIPVRGGLGVLFSTFEFR